MRRALISVSDKTNICAFAQGLIECGFEIISTGGTKSLLEKNKIAVQSVEDITGFKEILDGRVKTLHPAIHGGLLARRDKESHIQDIKNQNIDYIDLVCVNLYPFAKTIANPNTTLDEAIEQIDIGGPSMLRSSAKNYQFVTAVCDQADYDFVLSEIKQWGDTTLETKKRLSAKVFSHTAYYDAQIAHYLNPSDFPEQLTLPLVKQLTMRYGENPHQRGALYRLNQNPYSVLNATILNGKELSFNNIQDANATLNILKEFELPTCVAVKHMNPCGVACADTLIDAYQKAYESDPVSIFGGIVAFNRAVEKELAEQLSHLFLEIVIAPNYTPEALDLLKKKKNLRILQLDTTQPNTDHVQFVSVNGGVLIQDIDNEPQTQYTFECVTHKKPTDEQLKTLVFAQKIVKHVKSNAIVIATSHQTLGIGAGQMNRIGAAHIACDWVKEHHPNQACVLASDAFFPFDDVVRLAKENKIEAIIQPGGSIADQASIDACNELGIAMVFTHVRHFKH